GKTWKVIGQYTKTCPDIYYEWPVQIPKNVPSCTDSNKCLFAFSWTAYATDQYYHHCANILIEGVKGGKLPQLDMTIVDVSARHQKMNTHAKGDNKDTKSTGPDRREQQLNTNGYFAYGGHRGVPEVRFRFTHPLHFFVEDIDLQTLTITCKRLRSIAMDGPLRRHILLKRTPARLNSYLSTRPSRDTLATKNILRGIHIQQHIRQGQYIGGDTAVRSYNILCRLERQMVSIKISRKLRARPDWHELVERRLIPEEMFVNQDEYDTRRKWMNYQQQQKRQKLGSLPSSSSSSSSTLSHFQDYSDHSFYGKVHDKEGHGTHHNDNNAEDLDLTSDMECATASHNPNATITSRSTPPYTLSPSRPSRMRQRKSISMLLVPKIELLRKAMDRDRLSRLVQKRPSPSELNQSPGTAMVLHAYHLIAFSTTSPDLVPLTSQLSFLLKGERLRHWLYRRPSLAVILNERNILKTEVRTAWMVCPGVGQKVRFYENLIQERRDYDRQQLMLQQIRHHPHHHHPLGERFHYQLSLSPTIAAS
ncbi:hypothetical protein BGZ81_009097, partial [Podila clonocystis]